MHNATGPEPDYQPSVGPTMVSIPRAEYEILRRDQQRLTRILTRILQWIEELRYEIWKP